MENSEQRAELVIKCRGKGSEEEIDAANGRSLNLSITVKVVISESANNLKGVTADPQLLCECNTLTWLEKKKTRKHRSNGKCCRTSSAVRKVGIERRERERAKERVKQNTAATTAAVERN